MNANLIVLAGMIVTTLAIAGVVIFVIRRYADKSAESASNALKGEIDAKRAEIAKAREKVYTNQTTPEQAIDDMKNGVF